MKPRPLFRVFLFVAIAALSACKHTKTYTVGGAVSGLTGVGLTLQNNGGDTLAITANGAFTFATAIKDGAAYNVTVQTQPGTPAQSCTVTSGSDRIVKANVTNVAVACVTNTYVIGGTVTGLAGTVVLQNNGGDDLTLGASGAFSFATKVASSGSYGVTVAIQPAGQTCTVMDGTGNVGGADITIVAVSCLNVPAALGYTLFSAFDNTNGFEPWRTDGTTAGTSVLKSIVPGGNFSSEPMAFTEFNGMYYFIAGDFTTNSERLWKTDGTEVGTSMVKDVRALAQGSTTLAVYDGALYFAAGDAKNYELWKTDGTDAGTAMFIDINPGASGSYPQHFFVFNGALYFIANDGVNGSELWKTDSTVAGTAMLKDINPGPTGGGANGFVAFNNELYFTALDDVGGAQLWKTDGTAMGTTLVADTNPTGASLNLLPLAKSKIVFNNTLYFVGDDGVNGEELWKTDGTPGGTAMVVDIHTTGSSTPSRFTVLNGVLYFRAGDGVTGTALWKTDGTAVGTVLAAYVNLGSPGHLFASAGKFTVFGGAIYFIANDSANREELWKTDGTTTGTVVVKDICASINCLGYRPGEPFIFNGALLFFIDDASGVGLWRTDGTEAGTVKIRDICVGNCGIA